MKVLNAVEVMGTNELEAMLADTTTSKSAKVKTLFEQGFDVKEISDMVGIRYNFAYNVIRNHIVVNDVEVVTDKKETKKDSVYKLFDDGKTLAEVSKELKMNYNYVWKLHKEWIREVEKEAKAAEAKQGVISLEKVAQ